MILLTYTNGKTDLFDGVDTMEGMGMIHAYTYPKGGEVHQHSTFIPLTNICKYEKMVTRKEEKKERKENEERERIKRDLRIRKETDKEVDEWMKDIDKRDAEMWRNLK